MITVILADRRLELSDERPLVFGRADAEGVVGLDPHDMGISADAGSIECSLGVWWVTNRSKMRRLLIENHLGDPPATLECGGRHAITRPRLAVLVPGRIRTHKIEISVPDEVLARLPPAGGFNTSGTHDFGVVHLSERDRVALAAVLGGFLRPFPRRHPHPISYQEAANLLGEPWTALRVRKQIERLKERFAAEGLIFEGPHANHELADHLIRNDLLGVQDLDLLTQRAARS